MGETESDEPLEGTFAMIKPDAVDRASLIFTRIVKEGFLVIEQQRFRFSRELAELFYAEHKNKDFYEELMDYITSGPVIGMVLAWLWYGIGMTCAWLWHSFGMALAWHWHGICMASALLSIRPRLPSEV